MTDDNLPPSPPAPPPPQLLDPVEATRSKDPFAPLVNEVLEVPKPISARMHIARENNKKHLMAPIKKGEVRNPKGRPKGARSRFTEKFCQDVLDDWQEHGKQVMRDVRKKDPGTYLRVVSSLIPKQMKLEKSDSNFEKFIAGLDDDQLNDFVSGISAYGRARESEAGTNEAPDQS